MIRIDFTPTEIDIVANALAQRPYVEVYRVIEKLSAAVVAAQQAPSDAQDDALGEQPPGDDSGDAPPPQEVP